MSYTRFTRFRISALCFFPLLSGLVLQGQAPLTADRFADANSQIHLEWRIDSAERALESGLSGMAETIYRSILEASPEMSVAREASLKLGLARALIGQRRYVEARAQLESVPVELQSAQHLLYLALAIYGDGGERLDADAFRLVLKKVSATGLSPEDLVWFALLQGLSAELAGDSERAGAAYQRALESTDQPMLRSHLESLILRQKLLAAPPMRSWRLSYAPR